MIVAATSTTSHRVIKIIGMLHHSPKQNTTPRQWIPPASFVLFFKNNWQMDICAITQLKATYPLALIGFAFIQDSHR